MEFICNVSIAFILQHYCPLIAALILFPLWLLAVQNIIHGLFVIFSNMNYWLCFKGLCCPICHEIVDWRMWLYLYWRMCGWKRGTIPPLIIQHNLQGSFCYGYQFKCASMNMWSGYIIIIIILWSYTLTHAGGKGGQATLLLSHVKMTCRWVNMRRYSCCRPVTDTAEL